MSVRASLTAVVVVVVTLFVVGCAQTSSPTSPSASASSPSSPSSAPSLSVNGGTPSVQSTLTFAPLLAQFPCSEQSTSTSPLLAQLNLVDNFLVSANHELNLFLQSPSPTFALSRVSEAIIERHESADAILVDCVAPNYPHDPLEPGTDLLTLIIEQANITLGLLVNLPPDPPPPPSFPQIIKEAKHIIFVATTLKYCQKAPCWPPLQ